MTELTRKIEPADVINSLAGISIPIDIILKRRKLAPHELLRIRDVAERLLDLRMVIDVQKYGREGIEMSDKLFELATRVIHDAKLLTVSGPTATSVDGLLNTLGDAAEAGLYLVGLADRNLEERYKLVLRWMMQ